MKRKLVIPRQQAEQDVDDIVAHYVAENAQDAALGFIDELERAYDHIGHYSASGSPRYAHELNLPGVRYWSLKTYPYLIFYFDKSDCIDVWRVLHAERDIPSWMRDS